MNKDITDDIRITLRELMKRNPDIRSVKISRGGPYRKHYLITVEEDNFNQENLMESK